MTSFGTLLPYDKRQVINASSHCVPQRQTGGADPSPSSALVICPYLS